MEPSAPAPTITKRISHSSISILNPKSHHEDIHFNTPLRGTKITKIHEEKRREIGGEQMRGAGVSVGVPKNDALNTFLKQLQRTLMHLPSHYPNLSFLPLFVPLRVLRASREHLCRSRRVVRRRLLIALPVTVSLLPMTERPWTFA